jgi:hypothetical protein
VIQLTFVLIVLMNVGFIQYGDHKNRRDMQNEDTVNTRSQTVLSSLIG